MKKFDGKWIILCAGFFIVAIFLSGCSQKIVKEKEYTSGGQLSYEATTVDDEVKSELRRVFEGTSIEGVGIFENDNEGLARRAAIQLAVADLAAQVQTMVRNESVIYNNSDIRDVVETRTNALVNNYRVDFTGYDPGTNKYRARVSIRGEQLRREIEKHIVK